MEAEYRSLESAGQTTDSKAPKNSRIFIGFGGPQAHGDSVEDAVRCRAEPMFRPCSARAPGPAEQVGKGADRGPLPHLRGAP